jgi:hypothetical protein
VETRDLLLDRGMLGDGVIDLRALGRRVRAAGYSGFDEVEILSRHWWSVEPDAVLAIGIEPVRIDLLNRIDGVVFQDARANAVRGRYGSVEVTFIGKEDLLRNKRASGRHRDLGDVEELL